MLARQLELFHPLPSPRPEGLPANAVIPQTHRIEGKFIWVEVEFLIQIFSVDFYETGLSTEYNRDRKRSDTGYVDLLRDIQEHGYINPVFMYSPDGSSWDDDVPYALGNGHHRVVAALDLGYTHIPVTIQQYRQWDSDGCSTR